MIIFIAFEYGSMREQLQLLEQELTKENINNPKIVNIIQDLKTTLEGDDSIPDGLLYVPEHPLMKEAKDLGGAEAVAFGYNVLGTVVVNAFTQNTVAIALAGPVIEKLGFFLREFMKAVAEHRKSGKKISQEFKKNIANGIKNLLVDIVVHDSIYTTTMAYGLSNGLMDAWILSIVSFFIALPPAILVKHTGNELLHFLQKSLSKFHGFKREKYYEARFLMDNTTSSKQLFEQIGKEFNLGNYGTSVYNDTYYHHKIPAFSDRVGTVKDREIIDGVTGNKIHNIEIVHILPMKKTMARNSLYNYFYTRKEKGRKEISTQEITDLIKKFPYKNLIKNPTKQISFEREVTYGPEVRVTLDTINKSTKENLLENVIEIKVYEDKKALMEVMKYIMNKGNLKLTTYGKYDLL